MGEITGTRVQSRFLAGAGTFALMLLGGANSLHAATPITGATAILGINDGTSLTVLGTPFAQAGSPQNLNDHNTDTYDTTCCNQPDDYSYAGLTFSPVSANGLEVDVNFRVFGDGGWFGVKNNASTLSSGNLITPSLQTTTDGGATWTTVSTTTSNYVSTLTGIMPGNPNNVATGDVTFLTNAPVSGIDGFRLIGLSGGTQGQSQTQNGGFLGVAEISGTLPEPASLALVGFSALLTLRRRR